MVRQFRTDYYNRVIEDNVDNPKALFSTIFTLMGRSDDIILPPGSDDITLANHFSDFFTEKIAKIRAGLDQSAHPTSATDHTGQKFKTFKPFSEAEILKLIKDSKPTSCEIDPIPTSLLMTCLDVLLPCITELINTSLEIGKVPSSFKSAIIKPLLKKSNLDPSVLNNYRPVSNVSFLSKILEKAVKIRLLEHIEGNSLLEKFQSAYRAFHGTETALNRVLNDLYMSVDEGGLAVLVLLDLSAAFDTIDHQILLERLESEFGICGVCLSWFSSYLQNRKHRYRKQSWCYDVESDFRN